MDFEKNIIDIENEDDIFNLDEENRKQQGNETFESNEEFKVNEDNLKLDEENIVRKTEKKKEIKKQNESNSNTTSSLHSSGMSSLMGVVSATLGSAFVLGVAAGIIPTMSSVDVNNFLTRSTELGFEIKNESDKSYLMMLSNDDYNKVLDLNNEKQLIFTDLNPNTVYNLDVFELNDDSRRNVFSANYLTKIEDDYSVDVYNIGFSNGIASFDVDFFGENIEYITIELLDENAERFYFYEGEMKKHFEIKIDKDIFSGKISVNGYITFFKEYDIGGGSKPIIPDDDDGHNYMWNFDEYVHYRMCTEPEWDGIKLDMGEHEYELTSHEGEIYYYNCKICGKSYSSYGEIVKGPFEYKLNSNFDGYVIKSFDSELYENTETLDIPFEYNGKYVTEIDSEVFKGTDFITVYVPESIKKIGKGAFSDMFNLKNIELPFVGENSNLEEYNEKAFFGYIFGDETTDTLNEKGYYVNISIPNGQSLSYIPNELSYVRIKSLKTLYEGALSGLKNVKTIDIGGEIKNIPDYAFADIETNGQYYGNLKDIYLSSTIEYIGKGVFAHQANITTINFNGTKDEWNQIEKDTEWNVFTNITTISCSDGSITL